MPVNKTIKFGFLKEWVALGAIFGAAVVFFNALFGRFAVYFFISAWPVSAIPIGAALEMVVWAVLFLFAGAVVEGFRRLSRGGIPWHRGAQAASLVVLAAVLGRTLVDVMMRRGLFRFHSAPPPRDGWLSWALPLAALGIIFLVVRFRRGCSAETYRKDGLKLGLLALLAGAVWAVIFNRAMATTQLEVPLRSSLVLLRPLYPGLAVVAIGFIAVSRYVLRRDWSVERLAGKTILAAAAAAVITSFYYGSPPRSGRPHIIVSCWDTMRSSRSPVYGYRRVTTPFLNELVPGALIFDEAYTPSNYTLPTHASFFLGLSYRAHGYHLGDGADVLRYRGEFTLADSLEDIGYRTALFTENSWVHSLDKGFSEVRFLEKTAVHADLFVGGGARAGDRVSFRRYPDRFPGRMLLDWIRYRFDPFYAFTLDRIQLRAVAELLLRSRRTGPVFLFKNWMNVHDRYHPYGEWTAGQAVERYDFSGEFDLSVHYTDHRFRELYRLVESLGQIERTVFIVTSDHGEFIGEFNLVGHHKGLFEPVIRVPLMIVHPDLDSRRVSEPVSLDRFFYLVAALAADRDRLDSRELAEIFITPEPVVAEHGFLPDEEDHSEAAAEGEDFEWSYTVIDSDWQLVVDPELRRHGSSWPREQSVFLFDLRSDPERERDLSAAHPEVVERIKEEYREYLERIPEARETRRRPGLREDVERQLRSVGYLNPASRPRDPIPAPTP